MSHDFVPAPPPAPGPAYAYPPGPAPHYGVPPGPGGAHAPSRETADAPSSFRERFDGHPSGAGGSEARPDQPPRGDLSSDAPEGAGSRPYRSERDGSAYAPDGFAGPYPSWPGDGRPYPPQGAYPAGRPGAPDHAYAPAFDDGGPGRPGSGRRPGTLTGLVSVASVMVAGSALNVAVAVFTLLGVVATPAEAFEPAVRREYIASTVATVVGAVGGLGFTVVMLLLALRFSRSGSRRSGVTLTVLVSLTLAAQLIQFAVGLGTGRVDAILTGLVAGALATSVLVLVWLPVTQAWARARRRPEPQFGGYPGGVPQVGGFGGYGAGGYGAGGYGSGPVWGA